MMVPLIVENWLGHSLGDDGRARVDRMPPCGRTMDAASGGQGSNPLLRVERWWTNEFEEVIGVPPKTNISLPE